MSTEYERVIIGHLIRDPALLKEVKIPEADFSDENLRLVYREIRAQKGKADFPSLCEKFNKSLGATYIPKLLDELHKTDAKRLPSYIRRVRKARINEKIITLIEQGAKSGFFDNERLRELYEQVRDLDLQEASQEPMICETVEELCLRDIPPIDNLVRPIVERKGLTLIGATKGIGKSLWLTQLGLHYASGASPFLSDEITIDKPGRFLLLQQEVSLPGMRDRLQKMRLERVFDLGGRFMQKTTVGSWWDLTKDEDYDKLRRLIDDNEPDILGLDPLYTFASGGVNNEKAILPVLERIYSIKDACNIGVCLVHHFSNKTNPEDVGHAAGRFMGSSTIANLADNLISLDHLEPHFKNQILPLPYHHYVTIEITTRHGEWPQNFTAERGLGCLLFRRSQIYEDIGKRIVPGQIEDILAGHGGEMRQAELMKILLESASYATCRKAIDEIMNTGKVEKYKTQDKGKPIFLRLKSANL